MRVGDWIVVVLSDPLPDFGDPNVLLSLYKLKRVMRRSCLQVTGVIFKEKLMPRLHLMALTTRNETCRL